jgi:hypothetical protein
MNNLIQLAEKAAREIKVAKRIQDAQKVLDYFKEMMELIRKYPCVPSPIICEKPKPYRLNKTCQSDFYKNIFEV